MKKLQLTLASFLIGGSLFAQLGLISPANNTSLAVEGKGSNEVTITWNSETRLMGNVTYVWHLDAANGNFSNPIVSVPSSNMGMDTSVTLDFKTIDQVLAGANVSVGTTANLKWTVTATNGTSTNFSPDQFNINLTRGAVMNDFDLEFPTNSFAATIEGAGSTTLDVKWRKSGEGVTYAWYLDLASGNYSNPLVGPLQSNNMGMDTVLTLDWTTINSVLAGAGVSVGSTANLKWKIHAYGGGDSLPSSSSFNLDLTRGVILNDFMLTSPNDGFSATIEGKASNTIDISWMNAGAGATYDWYLDLATGDFSNPLVGPLASNNMGMDTVLTLDWETIDGVLAGAGVTNGNTANLKWIVKAKAGSATLDADTSFAINLTKGVIIDNFSLVAPADGFSATIDEDSTATIDISWNSAGAGATYKWFLDVANGDYSNALVGGLMSNNMGMDTVLTLDFKTIYGVLNGAGVAPGAEASLKWKVHAYGGNDSIPSGDYMIKLTKGAALSVTEIAGQAGGVSVWPNPVKQGENLILQGAADISEVKVIDLTGKVVIERNEIGGNETQIETSTLKDGMYILQTSSNGVRTTQKLIVE